MLPAVPLTLLRMTPPPHTLLLEDQLVLELQWESRVGDGNLLAIGQKLVELLGEIRARLLLQARRGLIVQ